MRRLGAQAHPTGLAAKRWWQSRMLWLNLISAVLLALEAQFALLQPYLPGNVYAWFAVGLTVGNAVLRVVTTTPIAGFEKGAR